MDILEREETHAEINARIKLKLQTAESRSRSKGKAARQGSLADKLGINR
jgi:hypothetical protein